MFKSAVSIPWLKHFQTILKSITLWPWYWPCHLGCMVLHKHIVLSVITNLGIIIYLFISMLYFSPKTGKSYVLINIVSRFYEYKCYQSFFLSLENSNYHTKNHFYCLSNWKFLKLNSTLFFFKLIKGCFYKLPAS